MGNKDVKEVIKDYRDIFDEEKEKEEVIEGKVIKRFIGPRTIVKQDSSVSLNDLSDPKRPFFAEEVGKDLDATYITNFRIRTPISIFNRMHGINKLSGIEFGTNMVKLGIIKDLESFNDWVFDNKIGLLDLYETEKNGSEERWDLRVYECISCAGLPNMGRSVCSFETGVITGALRELTNKEVSVVEERCWGNGYSACQFNIRIKPRF
jgi:predicted hydrocarbon binding protein